MLSDNEIRSRVNAFRNLTVEFMPFRTFDTVGNGELFALCGVEVIVGMRVEREDDFSARVAGFSDFAENNRFKKLRALKSERAVHEIDLIINDNQRFHFNNHLSCFSVFLGLHRIIIVVQTRSQIFRQIVQIECRKAVAFQAKFVQNDGKDASECTG